MSCTLRALFLLLVVVCENPGGESEGGARPGRRLITVKGYRFGTIKSFNVSTFFRVIKVLLFEKKVLLLGFKKWFNFFSTSVGSFDDIFNLRLRAILVRKALTPAKVWNNVG